MYVATLMVNLYFQHDFSFVILNRITYYCKLVCLANKCPNFIFLTFFPLYDTIKENVFLATFYPL